MKKRKSNFEKWMEGIDRLSVKSPSPSPQPKMEVHKMKCLGCDVIFFVEDSTYRVSTDLSCPLCEDDGQVDGFGIVTISI